MTENQKMAYDWAKNQNYSSVAARYAKELAGLVDDLQRADYSRTCAQYEECEYNGQPVCRLPETEICPHGVQWGREDNPPLSLEDLHDAAETGDPVWLVGMEDGDGWVRIDFVSFLTVGYSRFGDSEKWSFRTKSYGDRVWAYRHKVKEMQ